MAKTKKSNELTDAQLKRLASELIDKTTNIYAQAKLMFGEQAVVNDRTFERLERKEKMFRCEECEVWLGIDQRDHETAGLGTGVCEECEADRQEDDEDDEDEEIEWDEDDDDE